jgi:hypothetical protein
MATDTNEYRRAKGAMATLGVIGVGLYSVYQLFATGRVSWTTVGFLLFFIAAVVGNRYLLRLAAELDEHETGDGPK